MIKDYDMIENFRIDNHTILDPSRRKHLNYFYNGRKMKGYEGDTVASALYASGIRILSRSMKYHRPRGISCNSGSCSNCMMRVNGIPNVRTCMEPLSEGMKVESQNAWPSLEFDIASAAQLFSYFLRPGFQYKWFIRPRWAYHIWENFLRNRAGIGKVCDSNVQLIKKEMHAEPDILVIGGGIAGLSAAIHAAKAGAKVSIVEKDNTLGGNLRYQTDKIQLLDKQAEQHGFEIVSEMTNMLEEYKNCSVYANSKVFGWYAENILGMLRPDEFWELKPHCVVVATGSYEYPMIFQNNDLPGIFLSGGLLRLMHRDGIKPGHKAVVIGHDENAYILATQILDAGISVEAVCDFRGKDEAIPDKNMITLKQSGIPMYFNCQIRSALGKRHVKGVSISYISNRKKGSIKVPCDFICTCNSRAPANELIFQKNYYGSYVMESPYKISRKPDVSADMEVGENFYVAGDASGLIDSARVAYLQGKIAGLSAAFSLNYENTELLDEWSIAKSALKNTLSK